MTDLLAAYRAHLERRRLSPITIKNYCRTLRVALIELPETPTPADIEHWLDQHPSWSPKTASLYLTTLSGYYTWAVEHGHTQENPLKKIDKPATHKAVPHPISEQDLEQAITNAKPELAAILQLGARAGLRAKEIAAVHTADITIEPRPQLRVPLGKGDKARIVPLHPVVLETLAQIAPPAPGGYFFPGRPDGHQQPGTISRRVTDYFHDLGIRSTCHELRHRYATRLYQTSHDIVLVKEMLGHESIATTQSYAAADLQAAGGYVDGL